MPERFAPTRPNYLCFVSTPTIDIEPERKSPVRILQHTGLLYLLNTLDADVFGVGSVYISEKSKAISVHKVRHALALTIFIPTPF